MGGNSKKSKSSSSHHKRVSSGFTGEQDLDFTSRHYSSTIDVDLYEASAVYLGWNKFAYIVSIALLLLGISIGIGAGAGVSISIQYLDQNNYEGPSIERLAARERLFGPYFRFTLYDEEIADVSNNYDSLKLHRAITTQNRRIILMDVLEPNPYDATTIESQNASDLVVDRSSPGSLGVEPPRLIFSEFSKIQPKLCPDGRTHGFDTWLGLKQAIQEANAFTAEHFVQWTAFSATTGFAASQVFDDDSLYYAEVIRFNLCPGTKLKGKTKSRIYVNTENLVIEGNGASFDASSGTHFAFGAQAKNVMIRGIHFTGARTSSVTFYEHGADVRFEECGWRGNFGIGPKNGRVADLNSTSEVSFNLCNLDSEDSSISLRYDTKENVKVT